jgi:hypothetical protein
MCELHVHTFGIMGGIARVLRGAATEEASLHTSAAAAAAALGSFSTFPSPSVRGGPPTVLFGALAGMLALVAGAGAEPTVRPWPSKLSLDCFPQRLPICVVAERRWGAVRSWVVVVEGWCGSSEWEERGGEGVEQNGLVVGKHVGRGRGAGEPLVGCAKDLVLGFCWHAQSRREQTRLWLQGGAGILFVIPTVYLHLAHVTWVPLRSGCKHRPWGICGS